MSSHAVTSFHKRVQAFTNPGEDTTARIIFSNLKKIKKKVAHIFATGQLHKVKHIPMRRDVFQAIADPTRREIISVIAQQSLTLNGVADSFDMSRQAVSKHIKILTECGLIVIKQQGRERYCEAKIEKLNEVADWLAPFQKMWEHRFDKLDTLLTKMRNKKSKH